MEWSPELTRTAIAVVVLGAITTTVLLGSRVRASWAPVLAVLRAVVQLAAIGLILGGIIADPLWVAVAVSVMFLVGVLTVSGRLGWRLAQVAAIAASMALGLLVVLVIVFWTGAIEFAPRYVLAIGGITIGGVMQVATIGGRHLHEGLISRWDEVEGWLALGATRRESTIDIARRSVYSALVPSTDQAKTAGLVALPGSFVGAIFGGASPLEAARFQVVVFAALLAAASITVTLLTRMLAPVRFKPDPR
ncbi:MAG: ABC transporter permease [Rhodoglobus sp.]